MNNNQLNGHDAITAGMLVKLTSEKIDKLLKEKKLSDYPDTEGRVSRVFNRFKPSVFYVNFGGKQITLQEGDIESIN
ncbi:MAG: hypothetical protein ACM3PZ_00065 [Bacillota bacterium]